MSDATQARLRCGDCGKVYRVRDASRTYRCKACGGTVGGTKAERGPLDHLPSCPACSAVNPKGSAYCAECGETLVPDGGRPRSGEATAERRRAAAHLRKSFRAIRAITWLYRLNALFTGLATVAIAASLADPAEPSGEAALTLALVATLTVVFAVGSIQLRFHPFAWAVGIASLTTVNTAIALLEEGLSGAGIFGVAWALVLWSAVLPTVRFRRLVREHGDLYIAHRIHGTQAERKSGRDDEELFGRARRKALWLSAAIALVVWAGAGLGGWTVYATGRPEPFDVTLAAFAEAWERGDAGSVAAFFEESEQEKERAWLEVVANGHGWQGAWPDLGDGEWRQEESHALAELPLSSGEDGGVVLSTWKLDGAAWRLDELTVPLPPLDERAQALVDAWSASDAAAVGALFRPGSRERMARSLEVQMSRRGWGEAFPRIVGVEVSQRGRRNAEAALDLGDEEVVSVWQFGENGEWALMGLRFPER